MADKREPLPGEYWYLQAVSRIRLAQNGKSPGYPRGRFSGNSYMETLSLLDEAEWGGYKKSLVQLERAKAFYIYPYDHGADLCLVSVLLEDRTNKEAWELYNRLHLGNPPPLPW